MNLYKVKVQQGESVGIIYVGCDNINDIESLLIEKLKGGYDEIMETNLIAPNLIVKERE